MRMGVLMVPPHPTAVMRGLDAGCDFRLADEGWKAREIVQSGEGEGRRFGIILRIVCVSKGISLVVSCPEGGMVYCLRNSVVIVLALAACAMGQSARSKGPKSDGKIVVQEIVISGTTTLTSEELSDISNILTSKTMGDDDEVVEAYITYEFQQRGYFDAEVTNLKVIALDPLAKKKPVRVEAEVNEGPLYHLAEFKFTGNTAFSADELRQGFPLHPGDVFDAEKVRLGIESLARKYWTTGYLETRPVPDTQKAANGQVTVTFAIDEGLQYRMGALNVEGKDETAEKLKTKWDLKPGEPYNLDYLEKFLAENRELLPEGFDNDRDVLWLRDCADNTVNVTIELDPRRQWKPKPQDKPCEEAKDKPDKGKKGE
jgi:outer membrane translocation and assembly module TamA